MQEAKTVGINVVAWNSMAYIPSLLLSLDAQTSQDFSVTIVDNASNDGAIAWLQSERQDVTALRNFRNQGYARAQNQAAALLLTRWSEDVWPHRYLLIVKPDAEFAPKTIETMVSYMDANPDVMMCGPKVLRAKAIANEDGTREAERLTVIDSLGVTITKSRRLKDRGAGEEDTGQMPEVMEVFTLSGACLMLRASVVNALLVKGELFDEDFSSSFETVDLCWRMRRAGMRICIVPSAVVWHHRRLHTPEKSIRAVRNRLWLLIKNDEFGNLCMHLPWVLPPFLLGFFLGIFRPSRWKAWAQAIGGMPKMLAKRREYAPRVTVRGKKMREWFV